MPFSHRSVDRGRNHLSISQLLPNLRSPIGISSGMGVSRMKNETIGSTIEDLQIALEGF